MQHQNTNKWCRFWTEKHPDGETGQQMDRSDTMRDETLIKKAAAVINTRRNGEYLIGDVGCALRTAQDNIYLGVCIDTSSSLGFCAEASAIAAMTTAGESQIASIVAVWQDENGKTAILPPCGRCREFIYQIDHRNLETTVFLASGKTATLAELLPHHDPWQSGKFAS